MKEFLKNNKLVLLLYLLLLAAATGLIISFDKITFHLYVNQFVGNKVTDVFYYYITYLGDGRVAGLLLLLILIYNVRAGLYTAASFLTASLAANLLKYFYFGDAHRPFYIFQWIKKHPIIYVKGVEMNIHNSFPSGHATQAFAIFMCLIFVTKDIRLKLFFLSLAALTAFSRVYLSQHWLIDITVGSVIGTVFSLLFYYLFIIKDRFQKLNRPLFSFFGVD